MKTTLKKTLAILLATLILLGVTAAGASAEPMKPRTNLRAASIEDGSTNGILEIVTTGNAKALLDSDWGELYNCDLSGLVVTVSGGGLDKPQTVSYDEVNAKKYRENAQTGKIEWIFDFNLDWDAQPDGWKIGENRMILYVYGYRYNEFVPVRVVDGVQYGYFEQELIFLGEAPITLPGVERRLANMETATELLLDIPADVSIAVREYGEPESVWFKFTPAADGSYVFRSNGASYDDTLWTEGGEIRYFNYLDPWAELYDDNGGLIAFSDDGGSSTAHPYDFAVFGQLEAGKTYYLFTSAWPGGDYTVTVEAAGQNVLTAPDAITIKQGEYVDLASLLAGTTWELDVLHVSLNSKKLEPQWEYGAYYGYITGFTGKNHGKTTVTITAPDGESVAIKVTVKFVAGASAANAWEWIVNAFRQLGYYITDGWWYFKGLSVAEKFLLIPLAPLGLLALPFIGLILLLQNFGLFWF